MNLTWRQLIVKIVNEVAELDDTASIQHPNYNDEILHVGGIYKVKDGDALDGILDINHMVLKIK